MYQQNYHLFFSNPLNKVTKFIHNAEKSPSADFTETRNSLKPL